MRIFPGADGSKKAEYQAAVLSPTWRGLSVNLLELVAMMLQIHAAAGPFVSQKSPQLAGDPRTAEGLLLGPYEGARELAHPR